MDISGASILLTGATGGLGEATARRLGVEGARLTLAGRRADALEALAGPLGAESLVADLEHRDQIEQMAATIGRFDVAVINAAIGGEGGIDSLTPEEVDRVIEVNLRAPILLTAAFVQQRRAAGLPGSVVLIGSLSGMAATANTAMYNATKFGLRGFALSVQQDLVGADVAVSHVLPGMIRDAGMFARSGIDLPRAIRTKSPADVAAAVVKAIRTGAPEVYVAPTELRASTTFATVAPGLAARVTRAVGVAERTADASLGDRR